MLGCNQDVTVWLRKKIRETGQEIFIRRVLPVKCRWRDKTVIIPYFDGLTDLQIKEGDMMALGICDIDITGYSPYTAGDVKRLFAPNIATVRSVACHFDGQNIMKGGHMRLTGN